VVNQRSFPTGSAMCTSHDPDTTRHPMLGRRTLVGEPRCLRSLDLTQTGLRCTLYPMGLQSAAVLGIGSSTRQTTLNGDYGNRQYLITVPPLERL